jgi:hypothetical protein
MTPSWRDLDIGWFQFAVNDSLVVRRFQCLRYLECLVECGFEPALRRVVFPLLPVPDANNRLPGRLQSIDRGDIRMI